MDPDSQTAATYFQIPISQSSFALLALCASCYMEFDNETPVAKIVQDGGCERVLWHLVALVM
jgi:hypothetical protein